ncbi:MAG: DNA-binding protein [Gammaproteobacteria bacterium]|nr:DNA-binding protein [Gammaproteobacteria bacterium]
MARPGVTYTEVAKAAEQLVEQQQTPTLDRIRAIIGSGSNTTLAIHLKNWKQNLDSTDTLSLKENLPSELVSTLKDLWQRLVDLSDENLRTQEIEHQAEMQTLQDELQKFKSNNQRWQKMYETWIHEKKQLAENQVISEQALAFAQKENSSLQAKQDTLLKQLEEKQSRIDELNRLHKQVQTNLEHFRESTREQRLLDEEKQAELQRQANHALQQLRQEILIVNNENNSLKQQSEKINSELSVLQNAHALLAQEQNELTQQLKQSQTLVSEKEYSENHWKKQCESLQYKVEEQNCTLTNLQKDIAVISQQLSSTRDAVKELKDQNKLLTLEKWEIAQEKSQLQGQLKQLVSA